MVPGLLITEGSNRGIYIQFEEGKPFWIGRTPSADFVLENDPRISGKHCLFLRKGPKLVMKDESSNGTRLNGRKVHREMTSLKNTDILRMGSTHLQVVNMENDAEKEEFDFEACLEELQKRKAAGEHLYMNDRIGSYLTIDIIGNGACGVVYKALNLERKQLVALKVLSKLKELSEQSIKRFFREAELLRKLNHKYIIHLYDVGKYKEEEETYSYLALEYFQGVDLKLHLDNQGALVWKKVFSILYQLVEALDYMHSMGIIHRDLKPSNIMYNDIKGIAKIIDLGLGKCVLGEERQTLFATKPNSGLGTPDFMSIEQWESAKEVDERSDIYSLGATSYFLLTGAVPYGKGNDLTSLYLAVVQQKFKPLAEIAPKEVPEEFIQVISKMMSYYAEDRYPTSKKVKKELDRIATKFKLEPLIS